MVVTDIRMPPNFQREGIDAAKEMRKRHPGTGIVVLSPVRRPRVRRSSLLAEGAAGYALPAEGPHRRGRPAGRRPSARSRPAASMLDPSIVDALVQPGAPTTAASTPEDEELLALVAEGKPIKAIAVGRADHARGGGRRRRAAVPRAWPRARPPGRDGALRRLRHAAPGDRRPRGAGRDAAAGCCPAASPRSCAREGRRIGETERARRHRADARHPRLLDDRRARRPDRARRASSTSTGPR